MTHRTDIIALDLNDPVEDNLRKLIPERAIKFSPYMREIWTIFTGMVSVKDILAKMVDGGTRI